MKDVCDLIFLFAIVRVISVLRIACIGETRDARRSGISDASSTTSTLTAAEPISTHHCGVKISPSAMTRNSRCTRRNAPRTAIGVASRHKSSVSRL